MTRTAPPRHRSSASAARGRPNDSSGIGWAHTQLTGNFFPFLRQELDLGLQKEDAIEMYYNAAITNVAHRDLRSRRRSIRRDS
ncbi:MAG TPA: hypothetical protein VMS64_15120 [Candidatus Methylomirabilis sp.]|nr:hypothetical protein [Candidatus Methylomirabilis sp.]